ncbi:MAG: PEP-CTERM sorting domain-containing protein [Caldimonas sp.]
MRGSAFSCAAAALLLAASAHATEFPFSGDPFAGTTVTSTPGRQVVGGEAFISFSPATDLFSFEGSFFSFVDSIAFANGPIATIPSAGTNVVVLRTFDDDANAATPFGAGNAANLIAAQITTSGAGLFIYFNSGLDLARLVYSADLSENTADLKILARMTNLTGAAGRDAMQEFTAADFTFAATPVPEPATFLLLGSGAALLAGLRLGQRRR